MGGEKRVWHNTVANTLAQFLGIGTDAVTYLVIRSGRKPPLTNHDAGFGLSDRIGTSERFFSTVSRHSVTRFL